MTSRVQAAAFALFLGLASTACGDSDDATLFGAGASGGATSSQGGSAGRATSGAGGAKDAGSGSSQGGTTGGSPQETLAGAAGEGGGSVEGGAGGLAGAPGKGGSAGKAGGPGGSGIGGKAGGPAGSGGNAGATGKGGNGGEVGTAAAGGSAGDGGSAGEGGSAGQSGSSGAAGTSSEGGAAGTSGAGGSSGAAGSGGAGAGGDVGSGGKGGNGASGAGGGQTAKGCHLVVNEVCVSHCSSVNGGSGDEFAEVFNAGDAACLLDGFRVRYRSQLDGPASEQMLGDPGPGGLPPGSLLAPGAFLLLYGPDYVGPIPSAPNLARKFTVSLLSNSGGGIGIVRVIGGVEDGVAYFGAKAGHTYAEGSPGPISTPALSIGRVPDGVDTDDNATDFTPKLAPTPGAPN